MRFSLTYFLLALTAAAVAAPSPVEEAVNVPSPGTPQYDCHASCGGIISLSKQSKFCDRDDFAKNLKSCLQCGKKYDIWKYYGTKVKEAAESCDMDATPKEYSKDEVVTPTATAATTTVTSQVTVTADAESGASGKSGLAKGAIAGIVVSSVVGAIAIITASIFACKRRRQRQNASSQKVDSRGVKWEADPKAAERV
ncbi:hypothetical protein KEM54_001046 [Ascosphaera aggregata]|nr:hypothetical protein KEM54_001046 [Ascosphaera aggregata]